jgi:dCTP deaminase
VIEPGQWILSNANDLGVDPRYVNPASVDVCLGNSLIHIVRTTKTELKDLLQGQEIMFYGDGLYICHTREYIKMPLTHAAMLILKSSSGRKGLDHSHAGWIDPGFEGEVTFEFSAHLPTTFAVGSRIAQLVYMRLTEVTENPYTGRYQGQRGPTRAREYERSESGGSEETPPGN